MPQRSAALGRAGGERLIFISGPELTEKRVTAVANGLERVMGTRALDAWHSRHSGCSMLLLTVREEEKVAQLSLFADVGQRRERT